MKSTCTTLALLLLSFAACAQARDSVTVPASLQYTPAGFFRKLFLGANYRDAWATPVTFPVFRLSQTNFKIKELGGGFQTKSMELEDPSGKDWVLRTVDKEVSKTLPKFLQGTLAQRVVQDMISGAYPYAPLVVGEMARAAGVSAPYPTFYYVADDPAFGEHRALFAGQICMLEQRSPTPNGSQTGNSEDLFEDLLQSNDRTVDPRTLLQARLLDMLVGDWDRHADQYRWGKIDSAGRKWFLPIARDRDQAFFLSNGLLVFVARLVALPHLVGWRAETDKVRKLSYKSWNFDRRFLGSLTEAEWSAGIDRFLASVDEAMIDRAVNRLPAEQQAVRGDFIRKRLKSRRSSLKEDAMKYHRFLSRQIEVSGSKERETFRIGRLQDGSLRLSMEDSEGKTLWARTLSGRGTKEVILRGSGGADRLIQEKNLRLPFRLRLEGVARQD